jgi:hypothetical protein
MAMYAAIWPPIHGNTQWQNLFNTLPQTYRALVTAGGQLDLSTRPAISGSS